MDRVNLARESPVGISRKEPGLLTAVTGSQESLRAGWWLQTLVARGRQGRGSENPAERWALLAASAPCGSRRPAASPNTFLPAL